MSRAVVQTGVFAEFFLMEGVLQAGVFCGEFMAGMVQTEVFAEGLGKE